MKFVKFSKLINFSKNILIEVNEKEYPEEVVKLVDSILNGPVSVYPIRYDELIQEEIRKFEQGRIYGFVTPLKTSKNCIITRIGRLVSRSEKKKSLLFHDLISGMFVDLGPATIALNIMLDMFVTYKEKYIKNINVFE